MRLIAQLHTMSCQFCKAKSKLADTVYGDILAKYRGDHEQARRAMRNLGLEDMTPAWAFDSAAAAPPPYAQAQPRHSDAPGHAAEPHDLRGSFVHHAPEPSVRPFNVENTPLTINIVRRGPPNLHVLWIPVSRASAPSLACR